MDIIVPILTKEQAERLWYDVAKKLIIPSHFSSETRKAAYDAGVLPLNMLVHGRYYYGHCRNTRVALWDYERRLFIHRRTKWGNTFNETIRTMENDDGFDLFYPIAQAKDYTGNGESGYKGYA